MMSLQLQRSIFFENFSLIVARWGAHRGTIPTVNFFSNSFFSSSWHDVGHRGTMSPRRDLQKVILGLKKLHSFPIKTYFWNFYFCFWTRKIKKQIKSYLIVRLPLNACLMCRAWPWIMEDTLRLCQPSLEQHSMYLKLVESTLLGVWRTT
jgi:hypothetical protein